MGQHHGDEQRLLLAGRGKAGRKAGLAVAGRHVACMRSGKSRVACRAAGDPGLAGPHASDMSACNSQSGLSASLASTGQQKALLIAVVLAHARLQARRLRRPPVLLLDDVVAHLDMARRGALFDAVDAVGGQTWFSGTDEDDFTGLEAQPVRIEAPDGTARITTPEDDQ